MECTTGQWGSAQPAPGEPHLLGSCGRESRPVSEGDARAALASARLWGSDRGPLWPPLAGGCRPLPGPPATCICLARAGRSGAGSGAVPASGLSSLFLPLPADFCQGRAERKKKEEKIPTRNKHLYILWKENIFVNSYSFIITRVRSRLIKRFQTDAHRPPEAPSRPRAGAGPF